MSIRRNFVHNCITHFYCGLVWLLADLLGHFDQSRALNEATFILCNASPRDLKDRLVEYGERVHRER